MSDHPNKPIADLLVSVGERLCESDTGVVVLLLKADGHGETDCSMCTNITIASLADQLEEAARVARQQAEQAKENDE